MSNALAVAGKEQLRKVAKSMRGYVDSCAGHLTALDKILIRQRSQSGRHYPDPRMADDWQLTAAMAFLDEIGHAIFEIELVANSI